MAANPTGHDSFEDVGGAVVEGKDSDGLLMFRGSAVEERSSFAKGANRFSSCEIAQGPHHDGTEYQPNEQEGVVLIVLERKTDPCRHNAEHQGVEQGGPPKRSSIVMFVRK